MDTTTTRSGGTTSAEDQAANFRRQFERMGCAQLHDAAMTIAKVLDPAIVCRTPGRKLAGPAFPVVTDNDMLPCLQGLDGAPAGSVLFIHNRSAASEALAGNILTTAARLQGLAGLVVDGAIRDLDSLAELELPVFSRSVTYVSAKTTQKPAAEVPCRVEVGGVAIEAGDWLFGDADGLLLVEKARVRAVLTGAMVLFHRESELITALHRGERLGSLIGLTEFLAGRGPLRFEV